MTRPSTPADDGAIPVGSDTDEQPDAGSVLAASSAAADEEALVDAGLPRDGSGQVVVPGSDRRVSMAHRLYNGEAGLDVVGRSRLIYKITAGIMLICLLSIAFRGFNFGIDFQGGDSFRAPGTSQQLTAIRTAAEHAGAQVSTAQIVGGNTVLLRTGQLDTNTQTEVQDAIAKAAGVAPNKVSADAVSADWGNDITNQALIALVVFLVAVVAFLALRFQPKMAIGAMASLLHDIVLTAGVYSLIGFEVTPSTVIGFLTILGFSLYDTVVVFDKVRENTTGFTKSRLTYAELANLALDQTLMRSINTSLIALLPVAALLFVGAGILGVGTLKDLALAQFVGLAVGAYSSIFLATPLLVVLKEREPAVIQHDARIARQRRARGITADDVLGRTPAGASAAAAGGPTTEGQATTGG
jgi:preprotein translocase subunit SecF